MLEPSHAHGFGFQFSVFFSPTNVDCSMDIEYLGRGDVWLPLILVKVFSDNKIIILRVQSRQKSGQ